MVKKKKLTKILIIRFSSIGDIILTSPIIRCIKTQSPHTEIHYLTKGQNLSLLESNPYLSKVWSYQNNFTELIPQLRAEKFSFIVDLHKNFRSWKVILKLGTPWGTFPKINLRKWLIVNLKIDLLPPVHIVDRYFEAVNKLGIQNDQQGLDYFIPPNDEVDRATLPFPAGEYIAFVIGGKHNTKIFPQEKVTALCERLSSPVILLGGNEDRERADQIVKSSTAKIFNGCGAYSLNQSASVVKNSKVVITNDTGLMHIAAAFRKPILSVWGNTIPGFGMFPYLPVDMKEQSKIFEVDGLSCRPCSKIGFDICPKGHFRCMKDQDIEKIAAAVI
ncbi:MAG: glycosyltransferase family 9 protein [Bacteroidota bacterium]